MRFGLATRQLSTRRRRFRCGRIDWIMAEQNDFDHVSGKTTTGHEWDGIKELNTPLPRWWVLTFYACIIWAFGYWIVYPARTLPWNSQTSRRFAVRKWWRLARRLSRISRRIRRCSRWLAPGARRCLG